MKLLHCKWKNPNDYDWDSKMEHTFDGLLLDETANFNGDCCVKEELQPKMLKDLQLKIPKMITHCLKKFALSKHP